MTEPLNSEKRGCRECGGTAFHSVLCDLYRGDGSVLDSERSPERHEFVSIEGARSFCVGPSGQSCNQPRDAEVHQVYCDCLMPLGSKTCHHCKKPVRPLQPQPEAALCVECGHEFKVGIVTGQCLTTMPISGDFCGHRCTFPAPTVEAPAVAETCTWQQGDGIESGVWWTTCGDGFTFEADGPKENKMRFCCYCGKNLKEETSHEQGE